MSTTTRRMKIAADGRLELDVWEAAGIKPGDWVEVQRPEPGELVIRRIDERRSPASEQFSAESNGSTDEEGPLAPFTLDEVLTRFRIEEPVDEPAQQESWLEEAAKDSFRGDSVV